MKWAKNDLNVLDKRTLWTTKFLKIYKCANKTSLTEMNTMYLLIIDWCLFFSMTQLLYVHHSYLISSSLKLVFQLHFLFFSQLNAEKHLKQNWDRAETKLRENWDRTETELRQNWDRTETELSGASNLPTHQIYPKIESTQL